MAGYFDPDIESFGFKNKSKTNPIPYSQTSAIKLALRFNW
jgi:hypothetical protein